jgi:hypothetical protein
VSFLEEHVKKAIGVMIGDSGKGVAYFLCGFDVAFCLKNVLLDY